MKIALASVLLLAAYVHGEVTSSSVIPSEETPTPQKPSAPFQNLEALKIKLRDIPTLTFKTGRLATRRRTAPQPQLNCVYGCSGELPTSAQCENKGWDGVGVSWKCRAVVQKGRKFQDTRVRCEAFTEGDPVYILAGSCVLDYGLGGRPRGQGGPYGGDSFETMITIAIPMITLIVLVAILCFMIDRLCRNRIESPGDIIRSPPGGYYGSGGGSTVEPRSNPVYGQSANAAPVAPPNSGGGSALGAGLGGFAAGAVTGAALGYVMSNHGDGGHGYQGGYTEVAGGDYGSGHAGDGVGYDMGTDFADTGFE